MELKIQHECLLCSKKYEWGEVMYTKLPENASFCWNCIEKFEDNKWYKESGGWWAVVEWNPEITFFKD